MQYLTTSKVARELECSEAAVRKLAAAGSLPVAGTLADGTRLFDPSAISLAKRAREKQREQRQGLSAAPAPAGVT